MAALGRTFAFKTVKLTKNFYQRADPTVASAVRVTDLVVLKVRISALSTVRPSLMCRVKDAEV